jgi:hypothetical protein
MTPKQVRQEIAARKIYLPSTNQKYEYVRKNPLAAPPPTPEGIDAVMFA